MRILQDVSSEFNYQVTQKDQTPNVEIISNDRAIDLLRVEVTSKDKDRGLQTPWPFVNRLTKGFYPGDLIILSAPPKTGKTTFALNISVDLSFSGHKVLFYCLEMRPERLERKVIEAKLRKEDITLEDINQAARDYKGLPLYFAYSFKKQRLADILSLIKTSTQKHKFDFIVFDNIHFLVRSITNVNEELGQVVQGFKLMAEDLGIPILAIAQPRKRDKVDRGNIMCADDIKYSNSVHADCDQMILLHRKRLATEFDHALDPVTLVRVEAHRFGSGGECLLYFHGEYSRFNSMRSDGEV